MDGLPPSLLRYPRLLVPFSSVDFVRSGPLTTG